MKTLFAMLCVIAMAGCAAAPGSPSPNGGVESPGTSSAVAPPRTEPPPSPPAASGSPVASDSAAPSQEVVEWTDPYKLAAESCAEGGEPRGEQPVFLEPIPFAVPEGIEVAQGFAPVASSGAYVNDQGEIFRLDVIGNEEAVIRYTRGGDQPEQEPAQVCLDHQFRNEDALPAEDGPEEESAVVNAEPFGSNPDDLVIAFGLLGIAPDVDAGARLRVLLSDTPVDRWAGALQEFKADADAVGRVDEDNVVDFVFDPWISSGARHNYVPIRSSRIYFRTDTSSANVRAGACRNISSTFKSFSLAPAGPVWNAASDSRTVRSWYAGAVRGLGSGRYAVSGRSDYPGWYAKLDAAAPSNFTVCYP